MPETALCHFSATYIEFKGNNIYHLLFCSPERTLINSWIDISSGLYISNTFTGTHLKFSFSYFE